MRVQLRLLLLQCLLVVWTLLPAVMLLALQREAPCFCVRVIT